ncbi:alpha/beta hydrolase fold domain-containing protein [Streptomyces samsunensis]|uniref:Alpha/beta hydrolase fold domain-containing protein n=2 Tax=Streptomyces malaysiensis TaxID=92644 RepID=A0A9X2LXI4_STRMQ|nr:alpha/beta hydrolase fold domain-containing protein [Streptomyces samsunensis]MCQ8831276.1 alpha/beta hydrolase fold domain-containing protein [Streptomyces samsunensis]
MRTIRKEIRRTGGIFNPGNPAERAGAIAKTTTFHDDPDVVTKVSRGLGEAMAGSTSRRSLSRTGRRSTDGDRAAGELHHHPELGRNEDASMTTFPAMDPELAAAAAEFPDLDITDITGLLAARRVSDESSAASIAGLSYDGVDVREISAPGLGAAPDVPIRLLRPVGTPGPLPVLLAMHGGGFVLGKAQDYEYFCLEVVRDLRIAVANVEYRLAPETPFPGPLDDCYAALSHVHAHGEELGIDRARIAVGGSSAGGGLAAGTVLRARDEGGAPIAFQFLVSPALDDRASTVSARQFANGPILNRHFNELVWQKYLGPGYQGPGDSGVSPYAAPARATDLSGLPPTYIVAMELDPLRDDNIQYALRLLQAGVSVELRSHPGTFHGSTELAASAQSSVRAQREMLDALRRGLRLVDPQAQ